ncbi:ABC transporter permease [Halovivax gelatinilyticus]|uniref:ABC transporter permease n=1 Tax=Halovivax gelatinilyticus TaxID=2961597 RepID=UPI0020CA56A3|nr:ABC transporter permease subunit [Halovivax gelatinilyticus]
MSWRLIARKEVGDLYRNRQLHGNLAAFVVLFGLLGYVHARSAGRGHAEPNELIGVIGLLSLIVVPAIGLMLSYETIVKRRHNGQLALLLGFPHHRRDVVLGGYVGRLLVVTALVVAGFWTAGVVAFFFGASVPAQAYLTFLVATVLLALAYVAMGIALSAGFRSPSWASIAAFGCFLLFVMAWRFVPAGLAYVLNGLESPTSTPWWDAYVATLSPSVAYEELLAAWLPAAAAGTVPGGSGTGATYALAVFVGWAVLVPLAGYVLFDRTDL